MKLHNYHSIKLFISNHGEETQIADFKRNLHDAYKLMCYLNGELKTIHKAMPEKIYYYLLGTDKTGTRKMIAFYEDLPIGFNAELITYVPTI